MEFSFYESVRKNGRIVRPVSKICDIKITVLAFCHGDGEPKEISSGVQSISFVYWSAVILNFFLPNTITSKWLPSSKLNMVVGRLPQGEIN